MSSAGGPVVGIDECVSHGGEPMNVLALRERMPDHDARRRTAELFRLLGDPTRVSLLVALLEGGELCVCDLSAATDVAENVVSQALRLLRTTDVVRTRRDGRRIYYRLADAHVRMLLELSAAHLGHLDGPAQQSDRPRTKHPAEVRRGR